MPVMDGAHLAGALRAHPAGADLPLLLLSSLQTRLPVGQRALFHAALTKPARADVLHDALLAALQPAAAALHAIETAGGHRATDGPPPATVAGAVGVTGPVTGGAAVHAAVAATAAPVDAPASPRSLRVLLAEDNVVNQKVARLMLAKLGHRVDVVANGLEAVDAVRLGGYDVVLMDVQMPELDGLEATRIIRTDLPPDRQPPIVAMTANVQLEDRAACTAAGMDDYLAKPVRLTDLAAVLDIITTRRPHPTRDSNPADGRPAHSRDDPTCPDPTCSDPVGSTAPCTTTTPGLR